MRMIAFKTLALALSLSGFSLADTDCGGDQPPPDQPGPDQDVIVKDVVVLGGGASGTFAALEFKDANKSVLVVDKAPRLGGHTITYHDPVSGASLDAGVIIYLNKEIVNTTFGRYNITMATVDETKLPFTDIYVDFSTGVPLNFTMTDETFAAAQDAFLIYFGILTTNYSYLSAGFELPDPVPEDLTITFLEFLTKYSLQAMALPVQLYTQGFGDVLSLPTLYVMKYFDVDLILSFTTGFLVTAAQDNSLLYEAATAELGIGDSVYLNTTIKSIERSNSSDSNYTVITLSTPDGPVTVHAKQVLSSIPPTLSNFQGILDLTPDETALFSQFNAKALYTAIVRNSGLDNMTELVNLNPQNTLMYPTLPASYVFQPAVAPGGNLTHVYYGALGTNMTDDQVKSAILEEFKRVEPNLPTVFSNATVQDPEFAFFAAHSPYSLTVSAQAIKDGFYRKLGALQGAQDFWWTGAAFHVHNSASLWEFTSGIVQKMLNATTDA